jgi:hypothetical protein
MPRLLFLRISPKASLLSCWSSMPPISRMNDCTFCSVASSLSLSDLFSRLSWKSEASRVYAFWKIVDTPLWFSTAEVVFLNMRDWMSWLSCRSLASSESTKALRERYCSISYLSYESLACRVDSIALFSASFSAIFICN